MTHPSNPMKTPGFLKRGSIAAALLCLVMWTLIGTSSTSLKSLSRGFGSEPHEVILLFDPSWCFAMAVILAWALIAKDLKFSARVAEGVNLAACLLVIGLWCLLVWAARQPTVLVLPFDTR